MVSLAGDEGDLSTAEGGWLHGRTTLLGCAGSQFSQPMVDGWLDPFAREGVANVEQAVVNMVEQQGAVANVGIANVDSLEVDSRFQVLWLSLVHGAVLDWFRKPLLSSMRASVRHERHGSFCCHFGDGREERETLNMENRYLGYVCIVDRSGLVRWHTHSNQPPSGDDEVSSLARLIRETHGEGGLK